MKRNIVLLTIALSVLAVSAQTESVFEDRITYFNCDFTDGIPSDFTTYDRDGKTLHFSMTQAGIKQGEAWSMVREEFSSPVNYYAGSGSKHKYATGEETSAANDWMVTSSIWIKGADAKLTWYGKSFGEKKSCSSYNVYVSTTGNTPEDFSGEPIITVAEESATTWNFHEVSLAQYQGQRIYIAFVNNSFDKEILAIDDIKVEGEKGLCELLVTTADYVADTKEIVISANLTAYSDEVINSFTAYYEYNGSVFTKEISGLSLKKHDSCDFSFDQTISAEIGDTVNYKVWAEVNGIKLDTIEHSTISFLFIPQRKVVVEEGTGMWCTYCPMGIVAMSELHKRYPDNFIGVAVHYDDVMEVTHYYSGLYFPDGFPSAFINRKYYTAELMKVTMVDDEETYTMLNGGIETLFQQALSEQTHAEISIEAKTVDNKIQSTVTSRFAINVNNADYQIAIAVIENNVSDPTYAQANGYKDHHIPMGGFELLDDPIENFVYQEVARDIRDTYMGIPASVPSQIVAGKENIFEYSAAIPDSVRSIANIQVIAMLIDQKTGEIINAAITDAPVSGINDVTTDKNSSLTHKIDNNICTIDYSSESEGAADISIYSANGTLISHAKLIINEGKGIFSFDHSDLSGIYLISVTQGDKTASIKVSL